MSRIDSGRVRSLLRLFGPPRVFKEYALTGYVPEYGIFRVSVLKFRPSI